MQPRCRVGERFTAALRCVATVLQRVAQLDLECLHGLLRWFGGDSAQQDLRTHALLVEGALERCQRGVEAIHITLLDLDCILDITQSFL